MNGDKDFNKFCHGKIITVEKYSTGGRAWDSSRVFGGPVVKTLHFCCRQHKFYL